MIRKPAVNNAFYHGDPVLLREQVAGMVEEGAEKEEVFGVVSPHAGFVYSGGVAGAVYSRAFLPSTIVLLGPNHAGYGDDAAIMAEGSWEMPHGRVEIDSALAGRLLEISTSLSQDESAHRNEHSLEVQLPFIQHFIDEFRIVPILLLQRSLQQCEELGHDLARAIRQTGNRTLIVASTDMSHYQRQERAKKMDMMAVDRILELDHQGLYRTVMREGISMCGVVPTTVMLAACKELGASRARLVKYQTSGDVNRDYDRVVGYAGLLVS